jgi:hypothetical protein
MESLFLNVNRLFFYYGQDQGRLLLKQGTVSGTDSHKTHFIQSSFTKWYLFVALV